MDFMFSNIFIYSNFIKSTILGYTFKINVRCGKAAMVMGLIPNLGHVPGLRIHSLPLVKKPV